MALKKILGLRCLVKRAPCVYNNIAVQSLAMPATMPLGSYSLPKPSSGCPQGFVEGTVILPQPSHYGGAPTGLSLDGKQPGCSQDRFSGT